MKIINEDGIAAGAPTNNVGAGNIAGTKDNPTVVRKPGKIIRRKPIGVHEVFEVESDYFHRCRNGKRAAQHYRTFVGDGEEGQQIREYAYANPGAAIIVQDAATGAMTFLRYGKTNSFSSEKKNLAEIYTAPGESFEQKRLNKEIDDITRALVFAENKLASAKTSEEKAAWQKTVDKNKMDISLTKDALDRQIQKEQNPKKSRVRHGSYGRSQ